VPDLRQVDVAITEYRGLLADSRTPDVAAAWSRGFFFWVGVSGVLWVQDS